MGVVTVIVLQQGCCQWHFQFRQQVIHLSVGLGSVKLWQRSMTANLILESAGHREEPLTKERCKNVTAKAPYPHKTLI